MNCKTSKIPKISIVFLTLFAILMLSGCSDGYSTSDNDTQNTKALVAKAGVDFAVYELEGISLDASSSYDETDTLNYLWTQIGGKETFIGNNTLEKLTFIAPDVDNNTSIKFKLEVKDNKGQSSTDEIEIKIINVEKKSPRQEVVSQDYNVNSIDETVSIPFTYTIFPAMTTTTGLSIKIYWDYTKLEFLDIENPFLDDYMNYSSIQVDVNNEDNDKATNSYVIVTWLNQDEGKWLTPSVPFELMTSTFHVLNKTNGATYINVRSAFESPNVAFYSHTTMIEFSEI